MFGRDEKRFSEKPSITDYVSPPQSSLDHRGVKMVDDWLVQPFQESG